MFINANNFHDIGGFDTNLFLFYEESDVCRRLLKQNGKYTYLVPKMEYIHYKSKSMTKNIHLKIEQKLSLLYHTQKHYGWLHYKVLLIYLTIRYLFTSILKPKYWKLFFFLFSGAPISKSLKQSQKIHELVN